MSLDSLLTSPSAGLELDRHDITDNAREKG